MYCVSDQMPFATLTCTVSALMQRHRGISAMAVSPNRRFLAVAERRTGAPVVIIYDLQTLKKRKVWTTPHTHTHTHIHTHTHTHIHTHTHTHAHPISLTHAHAHAHARSRVHNEHLHFLFLTLYKYICARTHSPTCLHTLRHSWTSPTPLAQLLTHRVSLVDTSFLCDSRRRWCTPSRTATSSRLLCSLPTPSTLPPHRHPSLPFTHTHTYTHTHSHSLSLTHTLSHSHTHTHTHTRTHTHTHTHTHMHTHMHTITHTHSLTHTHIHARAHTHTHRYLVTLSGSPDWEVLYWSWEKSRGPMAAARVVQGDARLFSVTFNPHDNTQISVCGEGVLKTFRYVSNINVMLCAHAG
jgi:hypothetical protein